MVMQYLLLVIAALAAARVSTAANPSKGGTRAFAAIHGHHSQNVPRPLIEGGEIVQGREFPWLVSIRYLDFHFCVGTILDPEWILITASCMFHGMNSYSIHVGSNKLDTGGTIHELTEVILHEWYNASDSWINDIVLLMIHPEIEFKEGVSPASLVEKGQETTVGTTAIIAGWGGPKYFDPPSNDMHKIDVLIYDNDKCKQAYFPKNIHPTQMCAESTIDHHGPTSGDAAAPLMVDGTVIAITSWKKNKNDLGWPIVCTDLMPYVEWIIKHLQE